MPFLESLFLQMLPEFVTRDNTLHILRVVSGISLALLTIYRREMSCNWEYSNREDEEENILRGAEAYEMERHAISRRRSSPSLPNVFRRRSHNDSGLQQRGGPSSLNRNEDPTDELLESAGHFCSGGPLLAIFLAIIEHIVLRSFPTRLINLFEKARGNRLYEENDLQFFECGRRRMEHPSQRGTNLFNVVWQAGSEYFASIFRKFDQAAGSPPTDSCQQPTRSKSTGNLQSPSAGPSLSVLRDILSAASRSSSFPFEITSLPSDAQIIIFSHLAPQDLLSFTCTSRSAQILLDDCKGNSGDSRNWHDNINNDRTGNSDAAGSDTALLIWKMLWKRDFSWIVADWEVGRKAFLRSLACYKNNRILSRGCSRSTSLDESKSSEEKLFRHLLSTILVHTDYENIINFMETYHAELPIIHPCKSMKEFYFIFSETWLNYTIAGCNRPGNCLIGLHGHVFDISDFVEDHPGSTETLLLQAGQDATVFFESMGHSLGARKLALKMCAVVNRQCVRWDIGQDFTQPKEKNSFLAPGCGLVPPGGLSNEKNKPGFLIPRKRAKARQYGGLYHIRRRLEHEQFLELSKADVWLQTVLGRNSIFGGVHVYFDPFCSCWKWWYTDLDFFAVFKESVDFVDRES